MTDATKLLRYDSRFQPYSPVVGIVQQELHRRAHEPVRL